MDVPPKKSFRRKVGVTSISSHNYINGTQTKSSEFDKDILKLHGSQQNSM